VRTCWTYTPKSDRVQYKSEFLDGRPPFLFLSSLSYRAYSPRLRKRNMEIMLPEAVFRLSTDIELRNIYHLYHLTIISARYMRFACHRYQHSAFKYRRKRSSIFLRNKSTGKSWTSFGLSTFAWLRRMNDGTETLRRFRPFFELGMRASKPAFQVMSDL